MTTLVLHTGDTWAPLITLTEDGAAYPVPPSATVRAAITARDGSSVLAGPVSALQATVGSDWPNGVVVPIFAAGDTAGLSPGWQRLEVEVVLADGSIHSWSDKLAVVVSRGAIT